MVKYLSYLLFSLILIFLHQSFFASIVPDANINIIIVFLVFVTFVWGLDASFYFAIFIGYLQGFYSYLPFGTFIPVYLAIIVLVDYLHRQIFINFTFSTNLLLIIISTLFYNILLLILAFFLYLVRITQVSINLDKIYFSNLIWLTIDNLILSSLIYVVASAIFRKMNLTILIKR
ncbi:MAG: hypothetical protein NTZ49_03435 [Candidatus Parcubacteria bacterium]|nr:hypothetical protein [Candidatus Parcubacteria bacterium]